MLETVHQQWTFPFCPVPTDWSLDWQAILAQFSWIQAMEDIPQSPVFHAEGDVLIHTHMVAEALIALQEWRTLPSEDRMLLFASALLHDVAKPLCTIIEDNGHISSRGHALKGEKLARQILWRGDELERSAPFAQREYIAWLVRLHGLPLQFLDKASPERAIFAASQSIRMDHLALLAEADVRGRICADKHELLARVELFRDFCRELECYGAPRHFASDLSRFLYFRRENSDPSYAAYDTTTFEVVMMSALPGSGKDTWIRQHLADWPVISLDQIRSELHVGPTGDQGRVIQMAKERARVLMRQQQSFVWNATNISRMIRQSLIDFFASYGACVRIVYLDVPFAILLQRNLSRRESIPEAVLYRFAEKLEVPDLTEAHKVEWIGHDTSGG